MFRLSAAAVMFATSASAEMIIDDARLVAAFGTARAAAVYMEIKNEGESADALIGAYSADAMTMLHETVESDGVMKMEMTKRVEIDRFHVATLEPGGLHVMVMGLTPEMLAEDTFPLTLIFETEGEIEIDLPVQIGVDEEHGTEGDAMLDMDHGDGETE